MKEELRSVVAGGGWVDMVETSGVTVDGSGDFAVRWWLHRGGVGLVDNGRM